MGLDVYLYFLKSKRSKAEDIFTLSSIFNMLQFKTDLTQRCFPACSTVSGNLLVLMIISNFPSGDKLLVWVFLFDRIVPQH